MLSTSVKDLRILLVLLCGLLAFASCESKDQECYEPILVRASNAFVITDTQRVSYYMPDSTLNDSLIKVYRDSIMSGAEMKILNEDKPFTIIGTEPSSNVMRIALNPGKDSTRYTFHADTTAASVLDTITFYYVPTIHFISNSCGYNYYYTLNAVKSTGHLLDSVAMINNNVTNDVKVRNVQLYFKTDL